MKILLDFDSTTADLDSHMRASVNERFGTSYQHEDITSWAWWNSRPQAEHDFVWGPECFRNRDWTLTIPPVARAIAAVTYLMGQGHTFAVISDRDACMGEWLMSWLGQYGLAIPVHTTDKQAGNTKLDVARKLGLDTAIEDAPHHGVSMPESNIFERVLLLDKPWNRDVPEHPRLTRVFGWGHALTSLIY